MNFIKTIISYFLLFIIPMDLLAVDLYKSIQKVIHREVPSQDVDSDGVLDYLDDCPDSFINTSVNAKGCAVAAFVALLPNGKKHNAIVVENEMGSVEVDKAYTFVRMGSQDEEPTEPEAISKAELDKMFPFIAQNIYKKASRYTLYFSGTHLRSASQRKVKVIYQDIEKRKNPIIKIVGYTDSVGNEKKNLILGDKRAKKIKKLIDNEGLKYLQITLESMGEKNQKIKTKDEVDETRNRRAEILIQ